MNKGKTFWIQKDIETELTPKDFLVCKEKQANQKSDDDFQILKLSYNPETSKSKMTIKQKIVI